MAGLSPRVRGNPNRPHRRSPRYGPIPARAGEPRNPNRTDRAHGAYPRACGGTLLSVAGYCASKGLSPRVRGNPHQCGCIRGSDGPIPARAGEPSLYRLPPPIKRAYPRACGGTLYAAVEPRSVRGLSPRVRGNPGHRRPARTISGPIPARAGEPEAAQDIVAKAGAYPRACGGTAKAQRHSARSVGLSPRVRGNQAENDCVGA